MRRGLFQQLGDSWAFIMYVEAFLHILREVRNSKLVRRLCAAWARNRTRESLVKDAKAVC